MAKTTVPIELSSTPSIVDNGNATAITITSNEDIGLGTNSITNNTLGPTIYFGNGTSMITADSSSPRFWLGNNWYYNSGDKFIGTGYANLYSQQSGEHIFLTSTASGTAGASVSFNTVMKIDSSGNVGIGESSPSAKLTVNVGSDGNSVYIDGNGTQLAIGSSSSVNYINSQNGSAVLALQTNGSERMRIDSSGRVGIGCTPNVKFDVRDATASTLVADIRNTNSTGYGMYIAAGSGGAYGFAVDSYNNIRNFTVQGNGGIFMPNIASTASGYNDLAWNSANGQVIQRTSSQRYKENIQDLPSALDKVNALRPVTFDEIATGNSCFGLIAEEVVEQIPELVTLREIEGYDEPQPDSVTYSMLSVYLLKAIQEQQAIIEDLKARIQTLEGN